MTKVGEFEICFRVSPISVQLQRLLEHSHRGAHLHDRLVELVRFLGGPGLFKQAQPAIVKGIRTYICVFMVEGMSVQRCCILVVAQAMSGVGEVILGQVELLRLVGRQGHGVGEGFLGLLQVAAFIMPRPFLHQGIEGLCGGRSCRSTNQDSGYELAHDRFRAVSAYVCSS